jgi:hypothetical protein
LMRGCITHYIWTRIYYFIISSIHSLYTRIHYCTCY